MASRLVVDLTSSQTCRQQDSLSASTELRAWRQGRALGVRTGDGTRRLWLGARVSGLLLRCYEPRGLDRDAARCVNSVLVVTPHSGPRRAERARRYRQPGKGSAGIPRAEPLAGSPGTGVRTACTDATHLSVTNRTVGPTRWNNARFGAIRAALPRVAMVAPTLL
jgi:hypothetical protein